MRKAIILLALSLVFAPAMANAAGFRILEQDNAGQGQAHAVVASVQDAASVYYNPAAMVEVGGYAAKVGFQFIDPAIDYSGPGGSTRTDEDTYAVPHIYVVKHLKDKGLAFGLGLFSNFGLGTNWPNDAPFRYVATNSWLRTNTINANVAKKVSDNLSFAVGVDYMNSSVRFDSMFPMAFFEPNAPDGYQILEGDGDGWGFNLAFLYKPNEQWRIGGSYRSRINTTFTGDVQLLNFPGTLWPVLGLMGQPGNDWRSSTEVDLTYPDILTLGVSYQATNRLRVEVDIDYTGWSSYDALNFQFDTPFILPQAAGGTAILPPSLTQQKNWDNVVAFRFGASYSYSNALTLRTGYYFDPTPVPEGTFDPRLPGVDRNLVSLGFGYKATDNFFIDVAYAYLWTGSRSVNNDIGAQTLSSVDGDYENTTHIFGVSIGYQL